jgi:hypothetical protein
MNENNRNKGNRRIKILVVQYGIKIKKIRGLNKILKSI